MSQPWTQLSAVNMVGAMDLYHRIKVIARKRGYTMKELAGELGRSARTLKRINDMVPHLRAGYVAEIARILAVPASDLIDPSRGVADILNQQPSQLPPVVVEVSAVAFVRLQVQVQGLKIHNHGWRP